MITRGRPGQPQYGLAAVRSRSLTREGIFDGLHNRQTYGTTGARIILDFAINNVSMGNRVTVKNEKVSVHVRAVGTDVIDGLEILRHTEGQPGFRVIHQVSPAEEVVASDFEDQPPAGSAIYYVRLWQRGLVRERLAMAWSSPIWITIK